MDLPLARIRAMLELLCENALPPDELTQLQLALLKDSEARQLYREFFYVHSLLHNNFRGSAWRAEVIKGSCPEPSHAPPETPIITDTLMTVRVIESPILSAIKPTATRRGLRLTWRAVTASILAVAAVFYGVFIGLAWNIRSKAFVQQANPPSTVTSPPIAAVTAVRDCRWESGSFAPTLGQTLGAGEIRLVEGVMELEFSTGARVVVEGPAKFDPRESHQIYLHAGKLTARVPAKAIGFTVETPTAQVVDLGTEFSVEVAERGTTEVHTFVGKVAVDVTKSRNSGNLSASRIITAGQAVRVERAATNDEPVVKSTPIDARGFIRSISQGQRTLLTVAGARASGSFSFGPGSNYNNDVHCLIDGSGLREGAHSNVPDKTMWLSPAGKVEGEWVVFDMGRLRILHSMKVWNYNEASFKLYQARGLARGDIYVSSTGKGTPLMNPTEWSLIVADCPFKPGTGANDYKTPDVISLGNVRARFVAIVVNSCFGEDPRYSGRQWRHVGLSEVQFFGDPMPPPQ